MKPLPPLFLLVLMTVAAGAAGWLGARAPHHGEPAETPAGAYASLHGLRMYYEIHGTGARALLALHGGGGGIEDLDRQIPELAKRYRVIAPEQQGHGRTGDIDRPLSYHAMAEDTLALLDLLRVDRADCFGWSDGGDVCLDLAMHHPDRIGRVVTSGANARPEGTRPDAIAWARRARGVDLVDPARYARLSPDPPAHIEIIGRKVLDLWTREPQWTDADLATIRAPVLLIAGEHDMTIRAHTDWMAASIPHAEELIFPGASHHVLREQPAPFNAAVLAFLAR